MFDDFKITDLVPKRSEFELSILEKTFFLTTNPVFFKLQ